MYYIVFHKSSSNATYKIRLLVIDFRILHVVGLSRLRLPLLISKSAKNTRSRSTFLLVLEKRVTCSSSSSGKNGNGAACCKMSTHIPPGTARAPLVQSQLLLKLCTAERNAATWWFPAYSENSWNDTLLLHDSRREMTPRSRPFLIEMKS